MMTVKLKLWSNYYSNLMKMHINRKLFLCSIFYLFNSTWSGWAFSRKRSANARKGWKTTPLPGNFPKFKAQRFIQSHYTQKQCCRARLDLSISIITFQKCSLQSTVFFIQSFTEISTVWNQHFETITCHQGPLQVTDPLFFCFSTSSVHLGHPGRPLGNGRRRARWSTPLTVVIFRTGLRCSHLRWTLHHSHLTENDKFGEKLQQQKLAPNFPNFVCHSTDR